MEDIGQTLEENLSALDEKVDTEIGNVDEKIDTVDEKIGTEIAKVEKYIDAEISEIQEMPIGKNKYMVNIYIR